VIVFGCDNQFKRLPTKVSKSCVDTENRHHAGKVVTNERRIGIICEYSAKDKIVSNSIDRIEHGEYVRSLHFVAFPAAIHFGKNGI